MRASRPSDATKRVKQRRLTVCLHLGHCCSGVVLLAYAPALGAGLLDTSGVCCLWRRGLGSRGWDGHCAMCDGDGGVFKGLIVSKDRRELEQERWKEAGSADDVGGGGGGGGGCCCDAAERRE